MGFRLVSKAFRNEGKIPDLYTCKGENISPPLMWDDSPDEVKCFALIMEDLDTPLGTLTHWVLYNIPGRNSKLPEDIPHQDCLPDGTLQGKNGMRKTGYLGPCPPFGTHRYKFTLYALDTILKINPKMNKKKTSERN